MRKISTSKVAFIILENLILILIFQNLLFWIQLDQIICLILSVIVLLLLLIFNKKWIRYKNAIIPTLLVGLTLFMSIQCMFIDGIVSSIVQPIPYIIGILCFLLRDNFKYQILRYVTSTICFILFFSICGYILLLIYPFPPHHVSEFEGYDPLNNYLFFMLFQNRLIPRFSGPFVEPGHLSILCSFLLYANKFDFANKKELYVLLISTIISFSLAGYVLIFIAYMIHIRFNIKYLIIAASCVLICYFAIDSYLGYNDNPINELIVNRLEFDEEKGISGNNRTRGATDTYIDRLYENGDIWYGVGLRKYGELVENNILGGAGFKIFIIQKGVIGYLIVLLYYFLIAYSFKYKRYSIGFFFIIVICTLQRTYPSWMAWLIPYICSFSIYNFKKGDHLKNNKYNKLVSRRI